MVKQVDPNCMKSCLNDSEFGGLAFCLLRQCVQDLVLCLVSSKHCGH